MLELKAICNFTSEMIKSCYQWIRILNYKIEKKNVTTQRRSDKFENIAYT